MDTDLRRQYHIVSEELEQEKQRHMDRLASALTALILAERGASSTAGPQQDEDALQARQCQINVFSLLCLRISVHCRMLCSGYRSQSNELAGDIADAVEKVQSIERAWKVTDAVLGDALDVILAVCSGHEQIVLPYFKQKYVLPKRRRAEVTPELYSLFCSVADYYKQSGREELAFSMLETLCQISRERNRITLHQEVVVRVLGELGDTAPELVCKIGRADEDCFIGAVNQYAGDFFWLYACALQQRELSSDAAVRFQKCYAIRREIYGEHHWYTVVAKRECALYSFTSSNGSAGGKFLCRFIDEIENGSYPEIDRDGLAVLEGKTLYVVLRDPSGRQNLPEYESYLSIYERICERYDSTGEPLLKMRLVENLRGGYYFRTGDYIQAETAFLRALDAKVPEGVPEIVTQAQIKSNLLMIYYVENDLKMALPLLDELLELTDSGEANTGLSEKDAYRIFTLAVSIKAQSMLQPEEEALADLKALMRDCCRNVQENAPGLHQYSRELAAFMLCSMTWLFQSECISREEQALYFRSLSRIEQDPAAFPLDNVQKASLSLIAGLLSWDLGMPEAGIYFQKSLMSSESPNVPRSMRASILQAAAMYDGKAGKTRAGLRYLEEAISELSSIWQSYVRYLNDARLIQILTPTQLLFADCYAMLRKSVNTEAAYESVLQFKALASLAGRERNRILSGGGVDKKLLEQIRALQDKIAALESGNLFRDTSEEYEKEALELRSLEGKFARQFPQNSAFTEITWNRVKAAIPNRCVVVEYFYCALDYGRRQGDWIAPENCTGFDVYITCKKDGRYRLQHITIPNGEALLNEALEFVDILQAESRQSASVEQIGKVDGIRRDLYQKLIRPVLPYLDGVEDLYLAPDCNLSNLPFEILSDEGGERLEDNYNVIKIECARDFLFDSTGHPSWKGSLIIGNPQYELRQRDLGEPEKGGIEPQRTFQINADDIQPLPFSGIEVQQVGKRCGCAYYSGFEASKNLLLSASGYRVIHVATHGYFDLSEEGETMYSSCLLFAGVKNWLKTGELSRVYGNGIVTADEISRMDLRSVELVVLSSCLSGMNEAFDDKGFYGMIGAMSAAGVHYVISHLWAANDFTTAILMDAFYYQYAKQHRPPPVALSLAKNYLRQVTIGELKRRHWFDSVKLAALDDKSRQMIAQYENLNDWIRPFQNEAYWGGFACYRCN